jgi:hypothetical protein
MTKEEFVTESGTLHSEKLHNLYASSNIIKGDHIKENDGRDT